MTILYSPAASTWKGVRSSELKVGDVISEHYLAMTPDRIEATHRNYRFYITRKADDGTLFCSRLTPANHPDLTNGVELEMFWDAVDLKVDDPCSYECGKTADTIFTPFPNKEKQLRLCVQCASEIGFTASEIKEAVKYYLKEG